MTAYPRTANSETTPQIRLLAASGKFVYHCHILSYEDGGIMAPVEVVEEDKRSQYTGQS